MEEMNTERRTARYPAEETQRAPQPGRRPQQRAPQQPAPQPQPPRPGYDMAQNTDALLQEAVRILEEAKPAAFSEQKKVDAEELISLIERARRSLPKDVKDARWLIQQNQDLLNNTRREADIILQNAQLDAARAVDGHEITLQAEKKSQEILAAAQQESYEIHQQALAFARSLMGDIESQLTDMLLFIQKSQNELRQ